MRFKKTRLVLLAFVVCLSMFGSALAVPMPSPLGNFRAEPTPTPGDVTLPDPNAMGGGPGKPGDDGEGPQDGPGTGGKETPPEQPPPAKQEEKEQNIPTEVEIPEDKKGQPYKPKKQQVKEQKYVWSLAVGGVSKFADDVKGSIWDCTLYFKVTKAGGATMIGEYTGEGQFTQSCEHYLAEADVAQATETGPIKNIKLTLVKPGDFNPTPKKSQAEEDADLLAPLVPPKKSQAEEDADLLAPLVPVKPQAYSGTKNPPMVQRLSAAADDDDPPLAPLPPKGTKPDDDVLAPLSPTAARGTVRMDWEWRMTRHVLIFHGDDKDPPFGGGVRNMDTTLFVQQSGRVYLKLPGPAWGQMGFEGILTRKLEWVEV